MLSTGPLYEVREGDYLEALSKRFLVPVDNLLLSNPDVALGNSSLAIGTHSVSMILSLLSQQCCPYYLTMISQELALPMTLRGTWYAY